MAAGAPSPNSGPGRISTGLVLGVVYAFVAEGVLVALMFSSALLGNTQAGVFVGASSLVLFFAPGLYQWIYIIPVCIQFWRKQQPQTAKGLLIAALFLMCANLSIWVSLGRLHRPR
jgi:hypothetical protein